jgi:urease accessory protein
VSDDATLRGFRLADSFLPIGAYSASYGLERFVEAGDVADADDLRALLESYLRAQFGPGELVALRAAHAAALRGDVDAVCAADRRLTAVTLPAEFRESARLTGTRLLALQRDLRDEGDDDLLDRYAARIGAGDAAGVHATVLGCVTALGGVDERDACLLACHGFVTGLLGAAQRLLALGHTDAQRVLDDLRPAMTAAVDDSDRPVEAMAPFAPLVDVASAEHERADRRLFGS